MKNNKLSLPIKFLLINASFLIFSSCMMLNPSHHSSGHHSSKMESHSNVSADPVCGLTIESDQNHLSYQYMNNTYNFHSIECLEKFQKAPENYINQQHHQKQQHKVRPNNQILWGIGSVAMIGLMLLMML